MKTENNKMAESLDSLSLYIYIYISVIYRIKREIKNIRLFNLCDFVMDKII